MKYPTAIVENFFERPNDIVEYANTLNYKKPKIMKHGLVREVKCYTH